MFQNFCLNIRHFTFFAFFLFASTAQLSFAIDVEDIELTPAPLWVKLHNIEPIKDIPIDEVSEGIYYQMVDNQIHVARSGVRTSYARYVETIVNQAGLDSSSQLNISFDPSYQNIAVHSLVVIRDGQRIDKLQSSKKTLLNRESELNKQIYSGAITLNILLSDLQVGDTLDYSYTWFGSNPVYRDSFSYKRNLNWTIPVNIQHLRVLWGKTNPLFVTPRNITPTITQYSKGEFTEYSMTMNKAEVADSHSQVPAWYDPYSSIYFSESESWNDVVEWALPLYQFEGIHPSVSKIADDIKSQHSPQSEQIVAALKYTQDNIRYVGLEMGENSHVPTAPEETLSLRYGDCKDKASLLIAILEALDIEAYPALVDTENTKLIMETPPAANPFNHVIVSLEFDEQQI